MDDKKLLAIESKVNALVDMIGNRQESNFDALKIKDFIEKYSFIDYLLQSNTINSLMENIEALGDKLKEVESNVSMPINIIKKESNKLMDVYKDDKVQLSLNIADVKLFKNDIYISIRNVIEKISNLQIDDKIRELNSRIEYAKHLSVDIQNNKKNVELLLKKIKQEEELIKGIEDKNKKQDQMISYVETLIIEIEKQIEHYAFFSEEFNKLYLNAKMFIGEFGSLYKELKKQKEINDLMSDNMDTIINLLKHNYSFFNDEVKNLAQTIEDYRKESLYLTEAGIMFVNEIRAYNLSISPMVEKYKAIQREQEKTQEALKGFINELH